MSVSVSDIETALGRTLSESEQGQANQWIADALLLIEARLGDLAEIDAARLDFVVREAVAARFRNPEGYQSETIDDYTYRHGTATQRVTILDEWWDLLTPLRESGVFSARPQFEVDTPTADLDWA